MRFTLLASLALATLLPHLSATSGTAEDLLLWYRQPAKDWNQALPVGNGRLGAMVFGDPGNDRLQLNEDSLWSGSPQDADNPEALKALPEIRRLLFAGRYGEAQALANRTLICRGAGSGHGHGARVPYGSYQTLGDLRIALETPGTSPATGPFEGYRRELDLEQAVARVSFSLNGTRFVREVFASHPDQVLVVRLTADTPGAINVRLSLARSEQASTRTEGTDQLVLSGQMHDGLGTNGMRFNARLRVVLDGGRVSPDGESLRVQNANAATLLFAANTDYAMQLPDWRQSDPGIRTRAQLEAASRHAYPDLRARHVADHRRLFDRVSLRLGAADPAASRPTDERLRAVAAGSFDPALVALYFQYGRYLLIGSSRPGDLPANLQGIWADGIDTPWNCDYHANINVQMNYWPVDVANLGECFEPLERYIALMAGPGARTAATHYGARGWTVHTITNPWGFTAPGESPSWGLSPSAGAWLSQHLWEHFAFTRDTNYLRRVFPILRGSAEFSLDWLTPDPKTGKLLAGPATSPENIFITRDGQQATLCMGPSMEQQLVWDAFNNYLEAAAVLAIDEPGVAAVRAALDRLAGPQIGSDGRLLEWSEEFKEAEPGHRHVSHLFALHPGRQITRTGTPELATAARKSLEGRLASGGGHTGWSRAWVINFWARLGDGDKAGENVQALLAKSTLPNLFDTHPPFQIDGNFGGTAGIAEMLLQSHGSPGRAPELQLLPALPGSWKQGTVTGLRARGAITVGMAWDDGKLTRVTLQPDAPIRLRVRYGDRVQELSLQAGAVTALNGALALESASR